MKRLIAAFLICCSFSAMAVDEFYKNWHISAENAYTADMLGSNTFSYLFITKTGELRVGFTKFDGSCKKKSTELEYAPLHIVDNQPIMMRKQCIRKNVSVIVPQWQRGANFILKQFKANEFVKVQTPDGKTKYRFSAMGFTKAVSVVDSKARLKRSAL